MSFQLDELSSPSSAKISLNLNEDIISRHSQYSNYSNRNIVNNNINKNSQIYNQYNQQMQYQNNQIPRDSPISNNSSRNNSFYQNNNNNINPIMSNTPLKLIDFSHGFQINPQALNFLRSIKDEIIIVSVVGKARTGKSYLMNLLLDLIGKNNGFQVASSLES